MLYDPKWDTKTPTMAGFIAWLEQQPAEETYVWENCEICAIAGYAQSIGKHYVDVVDAIDGSLHGAHPLEKNVSLPRPHSYGAALKRARKYEASLT
jgi:hypothetical protein